MSWRPAGPADAEAVRPFSRRIADDGDVPAGRTCERHGWARRAPPCARAIWLPRPRRGRRGRRDHPRRDRLMPKIPDGPAGRQAASPAGGLGRCRRVGRSGRGARRCSTALGLAGAPATRSTTTSRSTRSTSGDLVVPDGRGPTLVTVASAPEIATAWRAAFHYEAIGGATCRGRGPGRGRCRDLHRARHATVLLIVPTARPCAMTGFNAASCRRMVQVGGVYTPPELRGRGHARRAVALHLAERAARAAGRAILFTRVGSGARAPTAPIGFGEIGRSCPDLLRRPAGRGR